MFECPRGYEDEPGSLFDSSCGHSDADSAEAAARRKRRKQAIAKMAKFAEAQKAKAKHPAPLAKPVKVPSTVAGTKRFKRT